MSSSLRDTLLFQHDPSEVHVWITSLPTARLETGSQAPDDFSMEEARGVTMFLEECIHRCFKNPYRYLENLQHLQRTFSTPIAESSTPLRQCDDDYSESSISPLSATLIEQYAAKAKIGILSSLDMLSIMMYLRKLFTGLLYKQNQLNLSYALSGELQRITSSVETVADYQHIRNALKTEANILVSCVRLLDGARFTDISKSHSAILQDENNVLLPRWGRVLPRRSSDRSL